MTFIRTHGSKTAHKTIGTARKTIGTARKTIGALLLAVLSWTSASMGFAGEAASGPLRVHRENPRYFSDASGKVVYLTGSHSWDNLRDWKPVTFDFDRYHKFLKDKNHNFVRLWAWDLPQFDATGQWDLKASDVTPFPWLRTGPGSASDGRPKFDLAKFNPVYFDRLRKRVAAAGTQGIYVNGMLIIPGSGNRFAAE